MRFFRFRGHLPLVLLVGFIAVLILSLPSQVSAASNLNPHDPIYINGNSDFSDGDDDGVINPSASGTENDPYIIENWVIDASNNTGINIKNTTAHFVVRNCLVENGDSGNRLGIHLYNVVNGKIENNDSTSNLKGLLIRNSSNNELVNNSVKNNTSWGVSFRDSSSNIIENNLTESNEAGILLWDGSENNTIRNNVSKFNEHGGIGLHYSPSNEILLNTSENNGVGIVLWDGSENNTIRNNVSKFNEHGGIAIRSASNEILLNTSENNAFGIILRENSDNNTVRNNVSRFNKPNGIKIQDSSDNNLFENNRVINNYQGFSLRSRSTNNTLRNNRIENNGPYAGIWNQNSDNTNLENNIVKNNYSGVRIRFSSNLYLENNVLSNNNNRNFSVWGDDNAHFYHDIDTSNEINGEPIYYVIGRENQVFDGNIMEIGYLGIVSSENMLLKNLDLSSNVQGVLLAGTSFSTVKDSTFINNMYAINFLSSSNNVVKNCAIEDSINQGLALHYSSDNNLIENCISENSMAVTENSDNNSFVNNSFENCGIFVQGSQVSNVNSHRIENNTVNGKPVYYYKNDSGVTVPSDAGEVILANCSDMNVENLNTVTIELAYTQDSHLENNILVNNSRDGLYLFNSENNLIENCLARNNGFYGGISLQNGSNRNVIRGCTVENNSKNGFSIWHSDNNKIISSVAESNAEDGVYLGHSKNNLIENCIARNNGPWGGITLGYSSSNTIRGCTAENNSQNGIEIWWYSDNNLIKNCNANNNTSGIYIRGSSNTVKNSITMNNENGFYMHSDSENNFIYHNNIKSNDIQAYDYGSNYWDNGSEGNYWSDYTGEDADNDGIGDTPYEIPDNNNQDRYPLMEPWEPSGVYTPTGDNVQVSPSPDTDVTFSSVENSGTTTVTENTGGPAPPSGYEIVGLDVENNYVDIDTTATYSGSVTVCLGYVKSQVSGSEENLKLMHLIDNSWEDITISVDAVNNVICGETESLSPFIVVESSAPTPPPEEGPVGGIVHPIDKFELMFPWVIVSVVVTIACTLLVACWRKIIT